MFPALEIFSSAGLSYLIFPTHILVPPSGNLKSLFRFAVLPNLQIVVAHGGHMEIESRVDHGTKVIVLLPVEGT